MYQHVLIEHGYFMNQSLYTRKSNQCIQLPDNSDPCSVGHFGLYGTLKPEKKLLEKFTLKFLNVKLDFHKVVVFYLIVFFI